METNIEAHEEEATAGDWITGYVEAWNRHDADAVVSFMTYEAVHTDLGLGERMEGSEAIKAFVEGIESIYSTDYRLELGQVIATDAAYSFEWIMSGTNDRADRQRGLPATGKRFAFPGVSIGMLHGGKITDNRDYWNLAAYLMQVGVMPSPGSPGEGPEDDQQA
jgi:steroid delta-isomerase-like uncharacterized protein